MIFLGGGLSGGRKLHALSTVETSSQTSSLLFLGPSLSSFEIYSSALAFVQSRTHGRRFWSVDDVCPLDTGLAISQLPHQAEKVTLFEFVVLFMLDSRDQTPCSSSELISLARCHVRSRCLHLLDDLLLHQAGWRLLCFPVESSKGILPPFGISLLRRGQMRLLSMGWGKMTMLHHRHCPLKARLIGL